MMIDEIADHLVANGFVPVFRGWMGDTPDNAVCVYEYAGAPPQFLHDGEAWENMRIQVVARDKRYQDAREKAQAIYDLLNEKVNVTIEGGEYLWIGALQSTFSLGPDANSRHRLVTNYEVLRRAS